MPKILAGDRKFFKGAEQIKYEGSESDNPMVYRWYDENRIMAGKSLKNNLRFAAAYRHSFSGTGSAPLPLPNPLQIKSCSSSNPRKT